MEFYDERRRRYRRSVPEYRRPAPRYGRPEEPPARRPEGQRVRRMVIRLVCSLVLLGLVLGGVRLMPERSLPLQARLTVMLTGDTDFQAAFSAAGQSLDQGDTLGSALGRFCAVALRVDDTTAEPEELSEQGEDAAPASQPEEAPAEDAALFTPPEEEPAAEDVPADATTAVTALALDYAPPLAEYTVTSPFGWREDPVTGTRAFHYGVDLAAAEGTAVCAFAAGTVEYVGQSALYGNYVSLRHPDGTRTLYAHCSTVCAVPGGEVALGEKIAEVGATGRATGPHLHLEVIRESVRLDPAQYLTGT